jgi:hypothetical protein
MLALWQVCISVIAVHSTTINIIDGENEAIARRSATGYCASRRHESVSWLLLDS